VLEAPQLNNSLIKLRVEQHLELGFIKLATMERIFFGFKLFLETLEFLFKLHKASSRDIHLKGYLIIRC
jgi:hypothetical protein